LISWDNEQLFSVIEISRNRKEDRRTRQNLQVCRFAETCDFTQLTQQRDQLMGRGTVRPMTAERRRPPQDTLETVALIVLAIQTPQTAAGHPLTLVSKQ